MNATTGEIDTDSDARTAPEDATEADGASPRRGWARRVTGWVIGGVSTLLVAAIVALAIVMTVVPAVAGGHTLTVLSGSMEPRLPVGSVVVDKPVSATSLAKGDIVTYRSTGSSGKSALITHRIVAVKHGKNGPVFTTKGDANNTADQDSVQASQIRGKLWYDVPYIGTTRNFLTSRAGLITIGGGVGLIVAVWFVIRLNRSGTSEDGDA